MPATMRAPADDSAIATAIASEATITISMVGGAEKCSTPREAATAMKLIHAAEQMAATIALRRAATSPAAVRRADQYTAAMNASANATVSTRNDNRSAVLPSVITGVGD